MSVFALVYFTIIGHLVFIFHLFLGVVSPAVLRRPSRVPTGISMLALEEAKLFWLCSAEAFWVVCVVCRVATWCSVEGQSRARSWQGKHLTQWSANLFKLLTITCFISQRTLFFPDLPFFYVFVLEINHQDWDEVQREVQWIQFLPCMQLT